MSAQRAGASDRGEGTGGGASGSAGGPASGGVVDGGSGEAGGAARSIPAGRLVGETTAPRDAATVLLLRDGPDGVEVLMLERHVESDFAGGAWVFPGGRVDPADARLPADRWSGIVPADRVALLGADGPDHALAFHVAAVRETFEEAGLLLATRDGAPLTAADLEHPDVTEARRRLNDRNLAFDWHAWLADHDLVLDLGALAFWSWWVTPHGVHKRYDTRFFVARAPSAQLELSAHDRVETTDSRWVTAEAALRAAEQDRATVIYPTRKNLETLAGFATAQAAWRAAAAGRTDQRRLLPEVVEGPDGALLVRHPDGGLEPG